MLSPNFIVTLLFSGVVARNIRRHALDSAPDGPVDPSTIKDCTYYDNAVDKSNDCAYFENVWGLTHDQFVTYNPSVKSDCSGIKIGNSYCVEENYGLGPAAPPATTTPTPKATGMSTTTSPAGPTGPAAPSPTPDGLISTCTTFYKAVSGDSCSKIVSKYGTFSLDTFIKWNPAVGSDCSGLWVNEYYCVGVPGTPTAKPPTSATPAPTGSGPSPTQDGIVSNCKTFYQVKSGDTCAKIVSNYGTFSLADFTKWNPAVGSDCSGLWSGYYYCVGIPGTSTAKSTTTTTTTKAPAPTGPSPTQDGIISSCNRFYQVVSGDTCAKIVDKYGAFSLADFNKWNPAVKSDCSGLWTGYYYCIGVPGTPTNKPTTTAKPPTSTTTGCTNAPSPTQPGAICPCKKWHKIVSGNTCATIEKQYGVSADQLDKWNPQVGAKGNCQGLWADYNVCVSA